MRRDLPSERPVPRNQHSLQPRTQLHLLPLFPLHLSQQLRNLDLPSVDRDLVLTSGGESRLVGTGSGSGSLLGGCFELVSELLDLNEGEVTRA